jgi:hypothetical protein
MALLFALTRNISLQNAVEIFKKADGREVNPNLGIQSALNAFERESMNIDNSIPTWSNASTQNGVGFNRRGQKSSRDTG